jgi:CubicO group peptidase (beta-lactamase class C family)
MQTKILRFLVGFLGLGTLVLVVLGARFVLIAAPGGAGFAAKQLCSLVYLSGLDPASAESLYVDKAVFPLSLALATDYDVAHRRVTSVGFGLWSATAEMRDGLGCTVTTKLDAGTQLPTIDLPVVQHKPLRHAAPETFARVFDSSAASDALARAFAPEHNTLAVVVLHRGELVAERYAAGIDSTTPLPGWSMAKSVTATLVGLLVARGRLDVNRPGIVSAWRTNTNGGATVTLDQLLRMTSGLDVVEDQSGADPNTRMLFVEPDAAAYAASRGLKATPGTHWEYMSGSAVLASKAVVEATGGTLESSQRFLREALLAPLGASSFVMEPDAAGTFIGSSFVLASARDWAKFGQLYLDDGVWEGERLLPEGWRDYVTRHTPPSGAHSYGAGFWTMEHKSLQGPPRDTFYANGFQGQWVVVIPSRSLVVVRLGASHGTTGTWQLIEALVSAIQ